MALYKCKNKSCVLYDTEKVENMHITYGKYGLVDHKISCPTCGEERERIDNKGLCTTMHGGINCCNR